MAVIEQERPAAKEAPVGALVPPPRTTVEHARKKLMLAVELAYARSNPVWAREYARCIVIAAVENAYLDVDDVNAVFKRRGSKLRTKTKSASGRLFKAAMEAGLLIPCERPKGRPVKSNNNGRGTNFYKSTIHQPGVVIDEGYDPNAPPEVQLPQQSVMDFWADPIFQRVKPEDALGDALHALGIEAKP
jgi:hypothetical protein